MRPRSRKEKLLIMNKEQYFKRLLGDSQWRKKNVKQITTDQIDFGNKVRSQIRQGGKVTSHVPAIQESIFEQGQRIPISVEVDGENQFGQTVYKPIDGLHRLAAIKNLAKKYPSKNEFKFVDVEVVQFENAAERIRYQIECNNHEPLPSKGNNKYDAALVLDGIRRGSLPGLVPDFDGEDFDKLYQTNPKFVEERLNNFTAETYGWTKSEAKRVVKTFLVKLPGKLENYNSDEIVDKFSDFANKNIPDNMSVKWEKVNGKFKVTFPETNILKLGHQKHVFPNTTGNAFRVKTQNEQDSSVLIIWSNDTIGKDFSDLDASRKKMIEEINLANSSPLLKRNTHLIDRIFLGPQKLDVSNGRVPLERGFYEVKKGRAGKFSTRIPKDGWNTEK